MKRITLVIAGILLSLSAFGQHKNILLRAPYNPDFIQYQEARDAGILKTSTPDGYKLDYVPHPMYLHFRDNHPGMKNLKSTNDFPDRYDLRDLDLITVPKDQGGGEFGGNCVAFATMGAIESRWLVAGLGEYDLSEHNIAACYGFEWGFGEGANAVMATAYLSRFSGPVLETEDPYNLQNTTCIELDPQKLVPESRFLPNRADIIKKALMDYGAVWASVHINYDDFDYVFNTYHYDGNDGPNHAWLVVGWDDNYLTTGGLGAWIIKNSWSDDWAEDGYVYCSYEDVSILSDAAQFNTVWETDEVDHIYMYDELGALTSSGYADPVAYGLAKFEATGTELLTSVGSFINAMGSVIEIEVYDDFDGDELTNLLTSSGKIFVEYPGFRTFDIEPTEVSGDFYIMVKYHTPGFDFPIPLEEFVEDYADPVIDTGVNWTSANAKNWNSANPDPEDETDLGSNLTIRAYTVDAGSAKALFEADNTTACINSTVTYTFLDNGSPSTFSWDFGEGASPATANTEGPHDVTYSTEGMKTVSLTVDGDTRVHHHYIDVGSVIHVNIPEDTIIGPKGEEYEISAFGAETYSWSPSDHLDTDVGQTVIFQTETEGTYTLYVEGTHGTCTDRDTLTIILNIPPINDDVCDAIELADPPSNINGVTNRNATVEFNEPFPPEGECDAYDYWCEEGGLQNSIWFKFIAVSEYVTFDGKGMDNQIAIYQAETCEDILNDNYTMVTAFDDYGARADFSFYMEANVEIGKQYWVQIDGSAGGDEGTFRLVYTAWPLDVEELSSTPRIDIYPNPSDGTFNIKLENAASEPVLIEVYNLSGQQVLERIHERAGDSEIRLDLPNQATGIYQVRIVQDDWVAHKKIILQ